MHKEMYGQRGAGDDLPCSILMERPLLSQSFLPRAVLSPLMDGEREAEVVCSGVAFQSQLLPGRESLRLWLTGLCTSLPLLSILPSRLLRKMVCHVMIKPDFRPCY